MEEVLVQLGEEEHLELEQLGGGERDEEVVPPGNDLLDYDYEENEDFDDAKRSYLRSYFEYKILDEEFYAVNEQLTSYAVP